MNKLLIPLLILLSPILAIAEISEEAQRVIDAYVEATGGFDNKSAVESIVFLGNYDMPMQGIKAPVTLYMKKPTKISMTIDMPNIGQIRSGYNGVKGWELNPIVGFRNIEGTELEQLHKQASIFPEVDIKSHYIKAIRMEDDKEGNIVLEMISKNKMRETWYFDPETDLLKKTKLMIDAGVQGSFPVTITVDEYQQVENVLLPFLTTTSNPAFSVSIKVDKIELNSEIADSLFDPPAVPQ